MFAGSGGQFDREGIAVEVVVAFECFDEQVVDWEPNRTAPIGVPAEEGAP